MRWIGPVKGMSGALIDLLLDGAIWLLEMITEGMVWLFEPIDICEDTSTTQPQQSFHNKATEKPMAIQMELPIPMKNYQQSYDITLIVVGCGGTGGYLVPNLARLVANFSDRATKIVLLDGDIVEQKNLQRQNFIIPDLGKPKAQVLAERYSAALGVEIQYETEYLKDADTLERLTTNQQSGATIVLGCVDNHRTRQVLASWYRAKRGRIWIDAGNEELHGQVICGVNAYAFDPSAKEEIFSLPCVADLFPEIDEDEKAMFNDELSCADRAAENPQNIATNIMAANYMLVFVQQVMMGNPLHTHGIFFSAERATADPMLNLPSRLSPEKWPGAEPKGHRPRLKQRQILHRNAA